MARRKNDAQLAALVDALELTLEIPICLACLSFVSMALDGGDERDIRSTVRYFAPVLGRRGSRSRRSPRWLVRRRPASRAPWRRSPTFDAAERGATWCAASSSPSARS